jgi:SAM-dependent methyltransferase
MYRCTGCETAFVAPQPSADQLRDFYSEFHKSDEEGGWYDQAQERTNRDVSAKLSLIERFAGPETTLLDVGCGRGFFVKACIDRGIRAQGLDLSDTAVAYARDRLHVVAHQGTLNSLKSALGRFRAVTLWATIEHITDPTQLLSDIADVTEPGGWLFLDTGVAGDWLEHLLPGVPQWYDPPQHLWVFSSVGLIRLLEAAGFSAVRVNTCYERNLLRKAARIARAAVAASALRVVAASTRLSCGEFHFTRFPLGNLMSVVARRNGTIPDASD